MPSPKPSIPTSSSDSSPVKRPETPPTTPDKTSTVKEDPIPNTAQIAATAQITTPSSSSSGSSSALNLVHVAAAAASGVPTRIVGANITETKDGSEPPQTKSKRKRPSSEGTVSEPEDESRQKKKSRSKSKEEDELEDGEVLEVKSVRTSGNGKQSNVAHSSAPDINSVRSKPSAPTELTSTPPHSNNQAGPLQPGTLRVVNRKQAFLGTSAPHGQVPFLPLEKTTTVSSITIRLTRGSAGAKDRDRMDIDLCERTKFHPLLFSTVFTFFGGVGSTHKYVKFIRRSDRVITPEFAERSATETSQAFNRPKPGIPFILIESRDDLMLWKGKNPDLVVQAIRTLEEIRKGLDAISLWTSLGLPTLSPLALIQLHRTPPSLLEQDRMDAREHRGDEVYGPIAVRTVAAQVYNTLNTPKQPKNPVEFVVEQVRRLESNRSLLEDGSRVELFQNFRPGSDFLATATHWESSEIRLPSHRTKVEDRLILADFVETGIGMTIMSEASDREAGYLQFDLKSLHGWNIGLGRSTPLGLLEWEDMVFRSESLGLGDMSSEEGQRIDRLIAFLNIRGDLDDSAVQIIRFLTTSKFWDTRRQHTNAQAFLIGIAAVAKDKGWKLLVNDLGHAKREKDGITPKHRRGDIDNIRMGTARDNPFYAAVLPNLKSFQQIKSLLNIPPSIPNTIASDRIQTFFGCLACLIFAEDISRCRQPMFILMEGHWFLELDFYEDRNS